MNLWKNLTVLYGRALLIRHYLRGYEIHVCDNHDNHAIKSGTKRIFGKSSISDITIYSMYSTRNFYSY